MSSKLTFSVVFTRWITPVLVLVLLLGSLAQSPAAFAESFFIQQGQSKQNFLSMVTNDVIIDCTAPFRVMPLGDSITKGSNSKNTNGYRKQLYRSLISSGYWVDFVGNRQTGSSDFDNDNEGHSGFHADDPTTTADILGRVYQYLSGNPADVVLLHIGTNDISVNGQDVNEISGILDEIDRHNPDTVVVLARIINRSVNSPETTQFNADLETMAYQRIASDDKILLVDMESALTYPDDLSDTIHPNDQGYAKMADVWQGIFSSLLPVCPTPAQVTSAPVTQGATYQAYTYDVEAIGYPDITYSLLSAPEGMTIDPADGVISWLPTTAGSYDVTVRASTSGGSGDQSFTIQVAEIPTPTPTSTPRPLVCDGLVQEAEMGSLSGAFTEGIDPAASGGGYVHVVNGYGDVYQTAGNMHQANFCFDVPSAGVYQIRGWAYGANLSSNSFFVQVDGAPSEGYLWDFPKNTTYGSDLVNHKGEINPADPVEVTLSAGTHLVTVFLREDGARLDKLELFQPVVPTATPTPQPAFSFEPADPASVGMDETLLLQARDYALTAGGSGYIIRHGKLVMAWGDPAVRYDVKSTTKSIGGTVLGLALLDGKLGLDDLAYQYHSSFGVPPDTNIATGWLDDITIRQLASHTGGFDKIGGYPDLLFQPGSTFAYSDGGANWLAESLTLIYNEDLKTLLFRRVLTPLGIENADLFWRNNAARSETINGIPNREFGAGIRANVEAMARIGYLYLQDGQWSGEQLIPKSFVDAVRVTDPSVAGLPVHDPGKYFDASDHYGLFWWNNADGALANVPQDAYWAWGMGDSLIVVIPSLDVVAVRAGPAWQKKWTANYDALKPFLEPISQSVTAP